MPAGRKSKCTQKNIDIMVRVIKAGAFDHVAARAAGVSPETFYTWMRSEKTIHRDFRRQIEQAKAEVRAEVEAEVKKINPVVWLTKGPGRERGKSGAPGWTGDEVHATGTTVVLKWEPDGDD